jgi:hypothetical protein
MVMGFRKMKNAAALDQDLEERLAALERRVADHESRLPPKPRATDAELIEIAWRASGLTVEEREFLTRSFQGLRNRTPGSIGLNWSDRLALEQLAARAPADPPPVQPIDQLLEDAAGVVHLSEREAGLITDARKWLAHCGSVPDGLREEIQRVVFLRFPERSRA